MKTHKGSCHCGVVTWEVEADIKEVIECNCSHCARKGFLLFFAPASQFKLLSGKDNLTEYRFNKKNIAHLFCKTCGVQSFGRSKDMEGNETVAVNARCVSDLDLDSLKINKVDGKSW